MPLQCVVNLLIFTIFRSTLGFKGDPGFCDLPPLIVCRICIIVQDKGMTSCHILVQFSTELKIYGIFYRINLICPNYVNHCPRSYKIFSLKSATQFLVATVDVLTPPIFHLYRLVGSNSQLFIFKLRVKLATCSSVNHRGGK